MRDTHHTENALHNLQGILSELDEEYNALDLISETLENALNQLKQEESTLRQTLSHLSCNTINKGITLHKNNSPSEIKKLNRTCVNEKKTKDMIENEALKRLESALFDSEEDENDSNSDDDTKGNYGNSSKPEKITNTVASTKKEDLIRLRESKNKDSNGDTSEKAGSSVSLLNDDTSSGSEIDEEELLKL